MSREHLFRGKSIKEGKWIEGKGIDLNWSDAYILTREYDGTTNYCGVNDIEVDPTTVCEFTGLTDKNGTKIFENDIVTLFGEKYSVKWKNNILTYAIENINSETKIIDFSFDYYEVIGNIFDNKELLNDEI